MAQFTIVPGTEIHSKDHYGTVHVMTVISVSDDGVIEYEFEPHGTYTIQFINPGGDRMKDYFGNEILLKDTVVTVDGAKLILGTVEECTSRGVWINVGTPLGIFRLRDDVIVVPKRESKPVIRIPGGIAIG